MITLWSRIKPYLTLKALTNELEPARVTAAYTAVVAVAATVGITLPTHLSGQLVTALSLIDGLLPVLAGEVIRSKVTPAAKAKAVDPSPILPDRAGHVSPDPLETGQ